MVKHSGALDMTFAALADPIRRGILARLARGDSSVTELARPYPISLPGISKHLRVLERAGLLSQEKQGRVRRCRLVPHPMKGAAAWIAHYQRFWEEQFDSLAEYLKDSFDQEEPAWPNHTQKQERRSKSSGSSPRRRRKSSRPGLSRKE